MMRTLAVTLLVAVVANAQDWPTFRHDVRRSGRTDMNIDSARLGPAWRWRSSRVPRPAWGGPAKWDAYAGIRGLSSMRDYDSVFHVAVADGAVYFGSSVDDALRKLDARTGKELWATLAGGPIRLAPTVDGERVWFGCDDGRAWCLDARDGGVAWTYRPPGADGMVLNDGRFISLWPVRTGVMVDRGIAYFAASMLPWRESWLCAVDAATGQLKSDGNWVQRHDGRTFEGALLATHSRLVSPQGRVPPVLFKRSDGASAGGLKGGGGSFALITDEDEVLHGPGNKTGWITQSDGKSRSRIATFKDGEAIVVDGKRSYLLTGTQLRALDRKTRKELWSVPCDCPYELVMAGDVLFCGGRDKVRAFHADDGRSLWTGLVKGRAKGLALADGALFVATDEGELTCFRPGRRNPVAKKAPERRTPRARRTPTRDGRSRKGLIGRWEVRHDLIAEGRLRALAGRDDGTLFGPAELREAGGVQALVMDGATGIRISDDHTKVKLPKRKMTVEAWVRVDAPLGYGGLVSVVRDNGADETGWLLGFTNDRFSFAVRGKEGPGRLTYLKAGAPFVKERWHHVVGTYDGRTQSVYVDGELAASSEVQKGDIVYPPRTWVELGAYHDTDEHFPMTGMLNEVCLFDRCLDAEAIRERHEQRRDAFPAPPTGLPDGPWVRFLDPRSAEVRWVEPKGGASRLIVGGRGEEKELVPKRDVERGECVVTLDDLAHDAVYDYRITFKDRDVLRETAAFELDTYFNHARPQPNGRPSGSARRWVDILEETADRGGIALVLSADRGRLVHDLARATRLRIVGVEAASSDALAANRRLLEAGLHGHKAKVVAVSEIGSLPFPDAWANAIIVDGREVSNKRELYRVLHPRGVIHFGDGSSGAWGTKTGGRWTHQYGLANNSAFGGETLKGASDAAGFVEQWLGRPGPRGQPDRSGRKPSPLAYGRKLFVQGHRRITTLDAWNGTILWSLEIPALGRMNVPRDSSNWCVGMSRLWVAVGGSCWEVDVDTGRVVARLPIPTDAAKDGEWDWGAIARPGPPGRGEDPDAEPGEEEVGTGRLIGSAVRRGTAYRDFWGNANAGWYDAQGGPVTHKVCSDTLFALDAWNGRHVWTYDEGLVINSTLTVTRDRTWFVVCRHPDVIAARSRRVGMAELWERQYLVCLDTVTGARVYEKPLDVEDGIVVFYMAATDGHLAMVTSANKAYHVQVHDADTGRHVWRASFSWPNGEGHHGSHMSRPAMVNGELFVRPQVFDLKTGAVKSKIMPRGGCGTYALTTNAVIYRDSTVTLWDHTSPSVSRFPRLRPGCWLSTIPALGLLLSPEAGGGCSCGNWMETSIAFRPK